MLVAMIALPACAQHGASHGGFSGHAAASSRGGFAASAPSRPSGYRGVTGARSPGIASSYQARNYQARNYQARGYQGGLAGNRRPRTPYTGSWRYRRPYEPAYRTRIPYIVPSYGWVSPYYLGYPEDSGYDDSMVAQGNAPDESGAEPPDQDQEQPGPLAPYQPTYETARPAPTQSSEEAVTLIFKDGRPPEQIHNYLLTRTTLFVGDQGRHAIPTDQLDLVATAKANHDAGVDFQLPNSLN